ncbi:MAG: hypothetical protein ACRYG8_53500 [Janthinobacterium lividum]
MRAILPGALLVGCLTGCGFSSGVVAVGPDTYILAEERAPVLGGGREADRLVLAEAGRFCLRQGRVSQILDLRPDGDPFTPYYPTAFDLTFRCVTTVPAHGDGLPAAGSSVHQAPSP